MLHVILFPWQLYPMFRGYTQQDSQEFLRYFMDQLHEELKEPLVISHDEDNVGDLEGKEKKYKLGMEEAIWINVDRV